MPLISIIIPCYNVENYIMRCFESLKNQTIGIENLELIFIDDASTDHTWEILSQIEADYPQNVVLTHFEENQRQGGARNFGLSIATGRYIGFVDADDWVSVEMYEAMLHVLTETESDFVYCRHIRDNGKKCNDFSETASNSYNLSPDYTAITIASENDRKKVIVENTFGHGVWDKLYRKSFLLDNTIDFPTQLTYEDIYFGTLLALYVTKAAIIEEQYYHYFVNSSSTVLNRNQAYHLDIIQVNELKWETLKARGFLNKYYIELQFDYLMTCFLPGFKMLCLRYDKIPYSVFLEMKQKTLQRVPDYTLIPYCQIYVTELYKMVLSLLKLPVRESELLEIQRAFCNYHGM